MAGETVLSVRNLTVHFSKGNDVIPAVRQVSFDVRPGHILALVGESGCGKTTTAMAVIGLLPPAARTVAGEILFRDMDIRQFSREQMRQLRGKRMAMIFQDPVTTLNPVLTVGTQLIETMAAHQKTKTAEMRRRAIQMLEILGIPSPVTILKKYPFQLSGGMCQRIMIAMAFLLKPDLLIADEPTTALDVTTQVQLLLELERMKREQDTGILLITHDLRVVAEVADEMAIMKSGLLVEYGNVYEVFQNPRHPYTRELLSSLSRGVFTT